MSSILKVENDVVVIGNDDGSITEARVSDCNFNPNTGDQVDVFKNDFKIVVTKKAAVSESQNGNSGININLSNSVGSNVSAAQPASGKVVNKVAYCLLAFFLGGIGIHKFYSGKIGMGILYILFSWTFIPSIVAFIEFIIGLTKSADSNGNIVI